ncbi:MAG: IclR family transcriptional regulator [Bifidobacteriaceae bacterium]|jgi:IclR family acetate operon transcriptional repressor|nr:IclR family transcriptional regulator [Bifidobacteriaceae bacterium]
MNGTPVVSDQGGFASIDRVVSVIDAVAAAGAGTLAQLARATGLSEPTTLRYLKALRKHHVVSRDTNDGRYRLGARLHQWGAASPAEMDPRSAAEAPLAQLAADLGETVELAGVEGGQLVVLASHPGTQALIKVAHVGQAERWHATAVGKALLANASPDLVQQVMDGVEFDVFTPNTLDSEERLKVELERCRSRGYAVDDEESETGLRCIGVPVRGWTGECQYAISASGPTYRMPRARERDVADRLEQAARQIEQALGAPLDGTDA